MLPTPAVLARGAAQTGVVSTDDIPCINGRSEGSIDHKTVKIGDVVQVNFRGSPPYAIARNIGHQNAIYCDSPITGNITTNTWEWTVGPVSWHSNDSDVTMTLLNPGDTVIFSVKELTSSLNNNMYTSVNYSIVDQSQSFGHRTLRSPTRAGLLVCLLALASILVSVP
ncbi:hypothetical protein DB88DRAFT_481353 [Papiliotrema laurentii]|uniref:Uncharacterized protein n=1 Tax=Papiliotrema laurentii TaxID=5418 RepID=A0AAD9FU08_PAPLA|nr:hypothetical protein DB88DRAFT_481353 [Papiliotrema laurentii]